MMSSRYFCPGRCNRSFETKEALQQHLRSLRKVVNIQVRAIDLELLCALVLEEYVRYEGPHHGNSLDRKQSDYFRRLRGLRQRLEDERETHET